MRSEKIAQGNVLHRDNSRFKFFFDNGKPVLPADCTGVIPTTPLLKVIRDRQALAAE